MREVLGFLITMLAVVACVVIIEVNSGTLNGGPGAMTKSDAVFGIGLKIYMDGD